MTPSRSADAADGPGARRLVGRYRLDSELGRGAMGTVWSAYDEVLHRPVAVKEVRLALVPVGERAIVRERTLREARATAMLSHPNVVTLYDVVEVASEPYVVMELLPSRSLAAHIAERGTLSPVETAEIGSAVASALITAHRAGITHRDVKPGNVLIGTDGQIKLTDFGIARNAAESSMTQTGTVLGSPPYIAPEVAMGRGVGPAADLWGLGATLFACLEGRPPYDGGDPVSTVSAVVHGEVPQPSGHGPVVDVVRALMVKDPGMRMPLQAVRRRLRPLLTGTEDAPLSAPPPPSTVEWDQPPSTEDSDQAGLVPLVRPPTKQPAPRSGASGTHGEGAAAEEAEAAGDASTAAGEAAPDESRPDDVPAQELPAQEAPAEEVPAPDGGTAGAGVAAGRAREPKEPQEQKAPAGDPAADGVDDHPAADGPSSTGGTSDRARDDAPVGAGAVGAGAVGAGAVGAGAVGAVVGAGTAPPRGEVVPDVEDPRDAAPDQDVAADSETPPDAPRPTDAETPPDAAAPGGPDVPVAEPGPDEPAAASAEPGVAAQDDAEPGAIDHADPAEPTPAEPTTAEPTTAEPTTDEPGPAPGADPETGHADAQDDPTELDPTEVDPTEVDPTEVDPAPTTATPTVSRTRTAVRGETTTVTPRQPVDEATRQVQRAGAPRAATPSTSWPAARPGRVPGPSPPRPGAPAAGTRPAGTGAGAGAAAGPGGGGQALAPDPGPLPFAPRSQPPSSTARLRLVALVLLLAVLAAGGVVGGYALTRALAGQPALGFGRTPAGPVVDGDVLVPHADSNARYSGTGLGFTALVPVAWQQFRLQQPTGDITVRFVSGDATRELRVDRIAGFFPGQRVTSYAALLADPSRLGVDTVTVDPLVAVAPPRPGAREPVQQAVYRTRSGSGDDRTTWSRLVPTGADLWVVRLTAPTGAPGAAADQFRVIADSFAPSP